MSDPDVRGTSQDAPAEKPSTGCLVSSVSWRRRSSVLDATLPGVPVLEVIVSCETTGKGRKRKRMSVVAGIDAMYEVL